MKILYLISKDMYVNCWPHHYFYWKLDGWTTEGSKFSTKNWGFHYWELLVLNHKALLEECFRLGSGDQSLVTLWSKWCKPNEL